MTRGEGGLEPAAIVASEAGDYAFLSLKAAAFDLSDRGVAGRPVPAGLDAFVYTERGVYRSGETVEVTALLRDARGMAAPGAPLTLVMERPDGVEYRRALIADQGLGGRSLGGAARCLRHERHLARARLHRSQAPGGRRGELSWSRTMCADRLEFDLDLERQGDAAQRPTPASASTDISSMARRPPASNCTGDVTIAAAKERAGLSRLRLRPRRR